MSTSIILLEQNFNANDVEILVFKPCVSFPLCGRLGGETHGPKFLNRLTIN